MEFKMNNNEGKCCGKNVIKGISCDVRNCEYHDGECYCTAGHIKVGPSSASSSGETLCATFKTKAE